MRAAALAAHRALGRAARSTVAGAAATAGDGVAAAAAAKGGVTATSLATALALAPTGKLTALNLTSSQDLRCVNLMCEGAGGPCVCRLAGVLEKVAERGGRGTVESLVLAQNALTALPLSLACLPRLTALDLSGNALTDLVSLQGLTELRTVALHGQRGAVVLDGSALGGLPFLHSVTADPGPAADALRNLARGRWAVVEKGERGGCD